MRGSNFSYLAKQGVTAVWRNRMMSFASFCILMVSLLLVGLSVLLMIDVGQIIGNIEEKNEVLVYVDGDIEETEIAHISDAISANKAVGGVVFYSKEEAFADYKEKYGEHADLFDYLAENPMPNTFKVTVSDLTEITAVVDSVKGVTGVLNVVAPYDFASFLVNMRRTLTIIGGAVLVALVVVCLVIVYNSIRSSVFSRRKEISIMKYVGATNSFIKIPFFIEGMFIGVLAGFASWGLIKISYEAIVSMFSENVTIWQMLGLTNIIQFSDITWYVLLFNCLAGALLGAIGTIMSMSKHLKV